MIELKRTKLNPIEEWNKKMEHCDNFGISFSSYPKNERYFIYKDFINEYLDGDRDIEKIIDGFGKYERTSITINRRDVDLNDAESIFIYGLIFKMMLLSGKDIKYESQ